MSGRSLPSQGLPVSFTNLLEHTVASDARKKRRSNKSVSWPLGAVVGSLEPALRHVGRSQALTLGSVRTHVHPLPWGSVATSLPPSSLTGVHAADFVEYAWQAIRRCRPGPSGGQASSRHGEVQGGSGCYVAGSDDRPNVQYLHAPNTSGVAEAPSSKNKSDL